MLFVFVTGFTIQEHTIQHQKGWLRRITCHCVSNQTAKGSSCSCWWRPEWYGCLEKIWWWDYWCKSFLNFIEVTIWHIHLTAEERKKWKSSAYDHYSVSLEQLYNPDRSKFKLRFKFTCRFDPVNHIQYRDRMMTGQGTSNLSRSIAQCKKKRGVHGNSPANAQQTLQGSVSKFTEVRHCAIVALCCAASHRAFNMVNDPFYKQEVELLRPGTKIPCQGQSQGISRRYTKWAQNVYLNIFRYVSQLSLLIVFMRTKVNINCRNSLGLFIL